MVLEKRIFIRANNWVEGKKRETCGTLGDGESEEHMKNEKVLETFDFIE